MSAAPAAFSVDLGGTRIRSALLRGAELELRKSAPTPRTVAGIIDVIVADLTDCEAHTGEPVDMVCISALGPTGPETGIIRNAPTLPGFDNVPIRDIIEARTGRSTSVVNDANAATYAEWKLGTGRGLQEFCYITVSTGIGAGFVTNGTPLHGDRGTAGELGRCRIRRPGSGELVQLEHAASGTAIAHSATDLADRTGHPELVRRRSQNGTITAADVAELAQAGDGPCADLMARAGTLLGEALANLTRLLDPEVFAVGGGVSRAGDCLWQPMLATMSASLEEDASHLPRVLPAALGDDAGLHGAVLLTRDLLALTPSTAPTTRRTS